MNDITFTILKCLVSVFIIVITTYAIPFLSDQIDSQKMDMAYQIVNTCVRSAEQVMTDETGVSKRNQVISKVRVWLNEKNIKITDEQIRELLEEAVYDMKQSKS